MKTRLLNKRCAIRLSGKLRVSRWLGAGGQCRGWSHGQGAFTMVEIALSIAIVAFALVAILGVLPIGMQVQRDNRDDTIINQDGTFLLEAIRSGSRGLDDLTNYFESITHNVQVSNILTGAVSSTAQETYTFGSGPLTFSSGREIVGLLSRPKYVSPSPDILLVTRVSAQVRALSGLAGEKSTNNQETAFRYQLNTELIPFELLSGASGTNFFDAKQALNLTNHLFDLRLTLQWPIYRRGTNWQTGNSRKTFRTLVSGHAAPTNIYYFFQPSLFHQL